MVKNKSYIKKLIAKMTLEEKVGALLSLGFTGTIALPHIYDYINKYHCGGLRLSANSRTFGNYVDPHTGKVIVHAKGDFGFRDEVLMPYCSPSQYRETLQELQDTARGRRLGLPLHFCFDQENNSDFNYGGMNIFPFPMGIRASGDPHMAYEVAKAAAIQARAIGINWIHSPVLDVNTNPKNPEIGIRAYSDDPEEVAAYAAEALRGFREGGVIATGKHFPGRGDSADDAHFKLPVIEADKYTMLNRELLPYRRLAKVLPSIMIAHSIFPAFDPDEVATVSKKIVTGLLRDTIGFEGVITTDSMTMGALALRYGVANACAMALEAGADLVLMKAETSLVDETFGAILRFVEEGRIPEAELDEKVYRVLQTKYEYGLFNDPVVHSKTPEEVIHSPELRSVAKCAALKSTLIARDRQNLLPLEREEKLLVIEQLPLYIPNDRYWHPGQLYYDIARMNRNADYLEVKYTHDEADKERIRQKAPLYDTIVVTNFYNRGTALNRDTIDYLLSLPDKRIVLVTNTPYEMTIPSACPTVVLTFSAGPDSMQVVADTLFGNALPQGEWPILHHPGE